MRTGGSSERKRGQEDQAAGGLPFWDVQRREKVVVWGEARSG